MPISPPQVFFLTFLAAAPLLAQQSTHQPDTRADIPRSHAPTPPPVPFQLNSHFSGSWTGTLEYRDYSAKSPDAPHTKLPTTLSMRPSPDGRAVNLDYTYDDGPDKTSATPGARKIVHEREILSFTENTANLTGTSNAQNQIFTVAGLQPFAKTGYGTLVMTGPGKENDKPVDLRVTITLAPASLVWLKESRSMNAAGTPEGDFVFRDQYNFTPDPR